MKRPPKQKCTFSTFFLKDTKLSPSFALANFSSLIFFCHSNWRYSCFVLSEIILVILTRDTHSDQMLLAARSSDFVNITRIYDYSLIFTKEYHSLALPCQGHFLATFIMAVL